MNKISNDIEYCENIDFMRLYLLFLTFVIKKRYKKIYFGLLRISDVPFNVRVQDLIRFCSCDDLTV